MYHDQGIAPFKALDPDCNIHYLGGLPLISTSTDMGPRYDIAGQNKADAQAFRYAIYQAIDSFRTRNSFDEPYANPLPKLYHERKDESEKVRFSIPKKHENAIKERRKPAADRNDKNTKSEKPAETTQPNNTPNAEQS